MGPAEADRLLDRLGEAADRATRISLVGCYLAERLHRDTAPPTPRAEVVRAWQVIAGSGGAVRIGDVATEVGWSTRHLTQQFTAEVGAAPKTVARLVRFHRSVTLIAGGTPIADAAAHCAYADQAHLTREWRRLAGITPARWPHQDVLANVQDARTACGIDRTTPSHG